MTRIIVAALLLLSGPALAEECKNGAIYEAEDNLGNQHLLMTKGLFDPYVFEMRSGGKLVWTLKADQGCSNGIASCWLGIGISGDETIDFPIESISENGRTKYVIFSDLRQSLARRYQAAAMTNESFEVKADWESQKPDDWLDGAPIPMNIYKFSACR